MASGSDQPVTEDGRSKDTRTEQTVLDDLSATEQILSDTLPESESDSREIKFDETLLNEFKRDYHRCGKYNLESQVVHLGRLANHYKKRYEALGHWTDCLKAHSLYNSCNARKPKSVIWAEKAFQMQQAYWNGCTSFSYEDQRTLTESLVGELEAIRTEEKNKLSGISDIVQSFESEPDDGLRNKFSELMKNISLGCTQKMRSFAGTIIGESVRILGQEPPCCFEAVAIGSLARGDATPYSDLEYIFLIDNENHESEAYFERLAVTSYFLIGNLGETKLSYMAIEELAGWFNDCSKNGFKIDGLSKEAGNIPTGNGAESRRSQFIITPNKLADRYGHVLNNPDGNQSRKGDLTAMLKFTRSLYVYRQGSNLLETLRAKMAAFLPNIDRKQANMEMLQSDMAKFRFQPDSNFLINGCAVDVKRQMYRFPSLLVLDLSIVFGVGGSSCWDVALALNASEWFKTSVDFILACASYIRLAAYIFHNSHNDDMSVAGLAQLDPRLYRKSHPQQRWQAPRELFYDFCAKLIPLSLKLTGSNIHLENPLNDWMIKIATLYFCGNDEDAFSLMISTIGHPSYEKIEHIVKEHAEEENVAYYMLLMADIVWSSGYNRAISLQIFRRYQTSYPVKYALALIEAGELAEVDDILSIAEPSAPRCLALSKLNVQRGRYDLAEKNVMEALQMENAFSSMELAYNYHGELEADKDYNPHLHRTGIPLPSNVDRLLEFIAVANRNVINIVIDLCNILIHKKQYSSAETVLLKLLDSCFKLYGDERSYTAVTIHLCLGELYGYINDTEKVDQSFDKALSIQTLLSKGNKTRASFDSVHIARTLCRIGSSHSLMKNYVKADRYCAKGLEMFRRLSPNNDSEDIALALCQKGDNLLALKDYPHAFEFYSKALAMYRRLCPNTDHVDVACVLCNIGVCFYEMKNYMKAGELYSEALVMHRRLSPYNYNVDIARILSYIGDNYKAMKNYMEAHEIYSKSLAMRRRLSPDTDSTGIAEILCSMGKNYNAMKDFIKADQSYSEALAMQRSLSPDTDSADIAKILCEMGENYYEMNHHMKAEKFLTEGLALYRRLSDNDSEVIARTLLYMGGNYMMCSEMKNHIIKAIDVYTDALAMYRRLSPNTDSENKAKLLLAIGLSYNVMKDYTNSRDFYSEALAMYRRLSPNNDKEDIAVLLFFMGEHFKTMKNYIKAEEFYTEAMGVYRKLGLNSQKMDDYTEAVYQYTEALSIFNSLHPSSIPYKQIETIFSDLFD